MMNLEARGFVIHDLEKFPIVSIRSDAVVPGYARDWAMEMDALINHGVPFAIVCRGAPLSESAADLAYREDWLRRN